MTVRIYVRASTKDQDAERALDSLKEFASLKKLKELSVRKNNIKDVAEIRHLKDLANLYNLWLQENPCAEHPKYRAIVAAFLPNL